MKNSIKNIFIVLFAISFLTSCVDDSFENPTQEDCVDPGLTKTKEVADLWTLSTPTTAVYHNLDVNGNEIPEYLEAIVVSSDEGGNFYKTMYLQPTDGSKGFSFSVDAASVYTKKFQPGKRVFLKLNGLAYANPSSFARGLIFGAPPTDIYAVDRLSSSDFTKHLIPTCDIVNEEDIVHKITLAQAIANDNYLNTLVEIQDVQFKTDCATYSKKDFDTSLKITSNNSTTLDLRTSRFASFAGNYVPSGRGTIRGVLSKYNNGFQIVIRTERDVKLTEPRVQAPLPAPKGGTGIVYTGAFTENFESYSTTGTSGANLPKYINEVLVGTRFWDIATFSNNEYIQMSAFNSGCSKSYFVMPVDMTAANGFSFKSKDGFFDGQPLKVYYSTDYLPTASITEATLIDITDKFVLASGTTSGYASSFTNSGIFNIPASITGNGYFIFEYDGTTGFTTTMQIDDVVVN